MKNQLPSCGISTVRTTFDHTFKHHPDSSLKRFSLMTKNVLLACLLFLGMQSDANAQACNQVEDFSAAITIGPSPAPGVWYVDRYAPNGFFAPSADLGGATLKHSIDIADAAINRPPSFQTAFYNTQGRKYDLPANTKTIQIDLYVPGAWATTNKREAGLWGTAFDGANVVSGYPILEFTSDGSNPRFRAYETGTGLWQDLGLPTGFVYDAWYTLEIEVLNNEEFLYTVGDLYHETTTSAGDGSIRLGNLILQGHNYDPAYMGPAAGDPGATYDIYWDNFENNIPRVQNVNSTELFCSIQAAIDDADTDADDVILLLGDLTEGLVSINKAIVLDGDGFTLTSTSATWGIVAEVAGVTIENITVQDAGTFGIITECGSDDLTITNTTVTSCGGTGFAINGVDNVILTNITATNNAGNGLSLTDCNNVTITGITTSGNAFGGGFSAGIGIFSGGACAPPAGTSNIIIGGTVNLGEPVPVYSQILGGGGTITGITLPGTLTHFAGIGNGSATVQKYYMTTLANAYTTAASLMAAPSSVPATFVHVEEISTGNQFVGHNLAPAPPQIGTYIMSIQAAITYMAPAKTVFIEMGSFAEKVTVTKQLTMTGAGAGNTILDGTGLGIGNGITISNGVTNVTIEDLTVRDYAGTNGNTNAGIYAIGGNNNLTVENVDIADNVGGSGFYANGPIDNVLLNNVDAHGHTVSARGIVIWNGLKSNITITNCEVYGNNCCGIELQDGTATGVTMTNNNVHDNGDNGIGLVGLQGPGANLIQSNMLEDNGRFGIEIKNPDGSGASSGAGSIVVDDNDVAMTSGIPDVRDMVGIAVFRRGVLAGNVEVPEGVYVSNNTVSGYTQASTSEGFGIVIEGINHTITGNNVTGNDVGLQQQAGHTPLPPADGDQANMADTYFGRGNAQTTCGNTVSGNTISGNTVDTRDVGVGGGLVTNDMTMESFCSIQDAIDAATAGDIISVAAGAYNESLVINKSLTLNGANLDTDCASGRGAESIITGAGGNGNRAISVEADNVVINGFTISNPIGSYGIYLKGRNNVDVLYNIITSIGNDNNGAGPSYGVAVEMGSAANMNDVNVSENCINNIRGGENISLSGLAGKNNNGSAAAVGVGFSTAAFDITNLVVNNNLVNLISACDLDFNDGGKGAYGVLINVGANASFAGKAVNPSVQNNEITNLAGHWSHGIGLEGETPGAQVLNNIVSTLTDTKGNTDAVGVLIEQNDGTATVDIHNNSFTSMAFGIKNLMPALADAECNWYGSANGTVVAAMNSGNIDYTSWLVNGTDNLPSTRGFQPVGGACSGTPLLVTSVTPDHILCGEANGSITVEFSGGTSPYNIAWTGGSDTGISSPYTITPLAAGSYGITVTDVNGSTGTGSTNVLYLPVANTTLTTYHATIQDAINNAATGNMISICAGTYVENIIVDEEVTLTGAGQASTFIYPALSAPNTCAGASLCPGGSNVVLIEANNVTIQQLTIDGDNTSLTSGVFTNGIDVDARNGIITNHSLGVFNNLNVNNVTVSNIYLRGMYASSGGTFTFNSNVVDNVAGEGGSIAIFNFGGAGTFTGNMVSNANDGIASNWSTGSVYSGNTVTLSASGIHTDNNGGSGGVADIIQNNTVTNSTTNGYGIWVFAPYRDVQVLDNTVTNVDVGLTNAGQQLPVTVSFLRNTVNGMNKPGSTGVYQTTSLFGFGTSDVTGIFSNNFIWNNADAFYLEYETGELNTITTNNNSITGNTGGVALASAGGTLTENFTCNWWGFTDEASVDAAAASSTNYTPWIVDGMDSDLGTPGFQPSLGACDGSPIIISSAIASPETCGDDNGSIEVTFSGGASPYNIAWSGTEVGSTPGVSSPHTITSLSAGGYTITVTDDNGSTTTAIATVLLQGVENITTPGFFYTIQAAINAANNNDIIEVCAGSYTENITINKPLTLRGPNVGTPGTSGRAPEALLSNCNIDITTAGVVVLDGFKIYQTDNNADVVLIAGGTEATIQNNIFERFGVDAGQFVRAITTSAGAGAKVIQHNLFTGDISGGLFSGHKTWNSGIYLNAAGSTVSILNNTIQNTRSALNLDDFNSGITISGNTLNNCGTMMSFGGVTPTNGQYVMGANNFTNVASTIMNLSNVDPAFRLDITTSMINGAVFNTLTLADLFLVESTMYHRGRSGRNGLVYYVANNQYVVAGLTTIQSAVDYADSGDIINVNTGNYNEEVTVDLPVTIDGATNTCSDVIIEGGFTRQFGVRVLAGIQNVNLSDFKVQNTIGTAGIWAATNNDGLNLDNLCLENTAGTGAILAQGPVNGITINDCKVTGAGVNGRGIVIWDGFKQNITITNNYVHDIGGCCGIELQDGSASGVNMTGNIVENVGDSGMSAVGLHGTTGNNTILNNTITNTGRFGLEIKNPDGDGTDILIDNNTITRTIPIVDLRDIAGIAVFRRALTLGNVDVPAGVTVTNNMVSGYTQPSTSEGFGIVIEGTNHTVTGNTVSNNDVGIQQQAGHLPYPGDGLQDNVSDNYFGRGNSPMTCNNTVAPNTYVSNGVDTRSVGVGGGLVTNTTTLETFCSIQSAIDDANTINGHTLSIADGTYNENVVVNKELTLTGGGNGSNPATNTVLSPSSSCAGIGLAISAANVTVQNMYVTGYQTAIQVNGVVNPTINNMALVDYCQYGITLAGSLISGLDILNTNIARTSPLANTIGIRAGNANGVNGLFMDNCSITGNTLQGIVVFQGGTPVPFDNITIQNSTISNNLQKGIYFEKLNNALFKNLTMNNNGTDATYGFNNGIDINLKYDDYANITIEDCDITNSGSNGTATDPENAAAIAIKARDDSPSYNGNPASLSGLTIINNRITGPQNGIRIGEFGKINEGPSNVTIEGNDLSHAFAHKTIVRRTNDNVNLVCNWHGTTSLPAILSTFADAGTGSTILSSILLDGTDGDVAVGFQPTGACGCPSGNLVTNTNSTETFCTIQAAIDDLDTDPNDVLVVGPGTYIENIYLDKQVQLRGNNFGINPNTGVRVDESIIVPATSDPDPNSVTAVNIMYLSAAASGSVIDGFTIDGDNPNLTSAVNINGANIDAIECIAGYDGTGNLTISNNILQNVTYAAIDMYNYYNSGGVTSGNYITDNKIDNVAQSPYGIGILIYNNFYAAIENNVITRVRAGVQTGNFYTANSGTTNSISNNAIQSERRGIFHNLTYGSASAFTLANNVITTVPLSTSNLGISLSSIGGTVGATVSGNNISGAYAGVDFWNCTSSALITVSGGVISGCDYGVVASNFDGYSSNANSAVAKISGVTITGSTVAAVHVKDNPSNTNGATIHLTIDSDCEINGSGQLLTGVLVTGPDATAVIDGNDSSINGFAIGIDVDGGTATINNNHIYDNGIGVRFINGGDGDVNTNRFQDALPNGTDIQVAANANAAGIIATPNNWFAGSSFGVQNLSATLIDATSNYWNDPSGPGAIASGTGANVTTLVEYCPWLGDEPVAFGGTGLPLSSPTVTITFDETSGDVDDDGIICSGAPVTLDATTPGALSYLWGGGEITPSIVVNPASTTMYTVTVTFASCMSDAMATVTVEPMMLVITDPASQNAPALFDLTAAGITAGSTLPVGTTFTYFTDPALTIPVGDPTSVTLAGTYYILATSPAGCMTSAPVVLAVTADPCGYANDFDSGLNLSNTNGFDLWYTDRYNPFGFEAESVAPGPVTNTLHVTIDASDGANNRLPAFSGAFYNTQGRKYNLIDGTEAIEADLYIPLDWATSGRRMAGLWGTGFDAADVVSAFPIIEFASDAVGMNPIVPRFRVWDTGVAGSWYDMGLPAGFVYDNWVTLRMQLLPSGEFLYTIISAQGDLQYTSVGLGVGASVDIANVILQGHNTTTGVTYDIYWDNLSTTSIPTPEITADDEVCYATAGHVASVPAGADAYAWSIDGGTITSATNTDAITYTAGTGTQLTLHVDVTYGSCTTTTSHVVVINPLPSATITTPPNVAESTPMIPATVPDAGAGATYVWSITNGMITSGQGTSSINYTSGTPGTLTIYVTVTDANGCENTGEVEVDVIDVEVSSMQWVPENTNACGEQTDCCANIICFGLEYTPGVNGNMTTYTTGFKANCIGTFPTGITPIDYNESCVMTDNSFEINGCAAVDSVLFNSSGNSGVVPVLAGSPIIIHKVCYYLPPGETVGVVEDEVTNLSVSIDLTGGGQFTEYPTYTTTNLSKAPPAEVGGPVPTSSTVECFSGAVPPALPVFHDLCGTVVNPTIGSPVITGTATSNADCSGTVIYTYTYTDCGGYSTNWVYTYTLLHTTAPDEVGGPVSQSGGTVECISFAPAPATLPVVHDVCGNVLSPIGAPVIGGTYDGCEGTYTYTYSYEDCADLPFSWTYTYMIERSTVPGEFGGPVSQSGGTVECISFAPAPTTLPVIHDVCGTPLSPIGMPVIGGTYDGCEGTYTYTYNYEDCADLPFSWTYTYMIVRSTAPGEVGGPVSQSGGTVECISSAPAPSTLPVIQDICGNTLSPTGLPTIGGTYAGCEGSYTYTYNYVDCAGLPFSWTYTYTIDLLTFADPVDGGSTVNCPLSTNTLPTPPVVTDNCGANVPAVGPAISPIPGCGGIRTYTWTYTDCANNVQDYVYTYTVDCDPLTIKVFLEGPYTGAGMMSTQLNIDHVLPGQDKLLSPNPSVVLTAPFTPFGQPYSGAPWNYTGNMGLNFGDPSAPGAPMGVVPYPATVVDWVLVTVRRNGILPANDYWQCAGWLHADGEITFPEPCAGLSLDPGDEYHVIVEHRNHLVILSPSEVDMPCSGYVIDWDFTTDNSYQPTFRFGQKEVPAVGSGVWAMHAANGEQISSRVAISSPDRTTWRLLQNALGYGVGDYNMNVSTNSADETIWKNNQNKTSGVIFN